MTIADLIAQVRAAQARKLDERNTHRQTLETVRAACGAETRNPTEDEAAQVRAATEAIRAIDAEPVKENFVIDGRRTQRALWALRLQGESG